VIKISGNRCIGNKWKWNLLLKYTFLDISISIFCNNIHISLLTQTTRILQHSVRCF